MPVLGVLALVAALAGAAAGQELAPGTRYDPAIPTLAEVVGHDFGEEISTPEQIVTYLGALAAAAPDRSRVEVYAHSWEGRPLVVFIIGSRDRMARIDDVKANLRRLADPRGLSEAEAERLVAELPAVTWLMHAVHGNEISSSDAALAQAYHLLAATGDEAVEAILRESVVLIDPLANPDGRARFIVQHRLARAVPPDPEPLAAEHDEPWPGGRSNHYLFDLNRDWLAQTQPETRGRTALYLEWFAHVAVDLHEMGGDSTYYFAPPADPINPHITEAQRHWLDAFGRGNAARFDARGLPYFIREVFDSFYPGYGESWPLFHGAIGMTYEQASARGLAWRRRDESVLTYRDGVVGHFTAALATAETAARNRERLLRDFLEYRRSAVQDGARGAIREYVLVRGNDAARLERLAALLVRHGIEVRVTDAEIRAGDRVVPAGSLLVSAAQPAGRLVRNLLDPHVPQDEAFVEEQDRRRRLRLPDQIYDVTAWSLPLLFGVELVTLDRAVADGARMFEAGAGPSALPAASVAYLLPWSAAAAAAVAEALQEGIRVRVARGSFTLSGRRYPIGTAIVRVADNGAEVGSRLGAIAARQGAEVVATDTGWVDEGISLGSNQVAVMTAPRVLLLWDAPAQSLSAGWARFVLEQRYGQPVTIVRVASLGRLDWRRFDVLVLPGGDYRRGFENDVLQRIKQWVTDGGTLVLLGEASRWATRENVGLLDTHMELRDGSPEREPDDEREAEPRLDPDAGFDYEQAIQPQRERPHATPGALLTVMLDTEHWLSAGHDVEIQVMVDSQRVLAPIRLDRGRNVGVYASADRLVAGGLVWDEARNQLAQKAFVVHQPEGRGHVIAFAEDPNYRAFAEAAQLLFMNAVLLGPAR